jgi:hypothetical protein
VDRRAVVRRRAGHARHSNGAGAPDHVERIEHRGGTVEARYQVMTQTVQRQVGAPGPGGRMASLRCVWSVDLTVRREARAFGRARKPAA